MGAFEYQAVDTRGRRTRGVLEGDTPRQIRAQLRDQGLTPLNVTEVASGDHSERGRPGLTHRKRISGAELALFTRQLATLLHSGLPLEEALLAVSQQTQQARVQSMIRGVRSRVMEGHTLARAMQDFSSAFPKLYVATVAAGESSGHLDNVLERLADYVENRQQLRQKIMLALFYPVILTGVAITVVIALLTYVVPQVVGVFQDIHHQLPFLTRGLIAFSNFLKSDGLILLILLVAAAVAWFYAMRRDAFRRRVHRNILKIPLVGKLARNINTGRFARTLAILVSAGVPALEAMHISTQVVSNLPMREATEEATRRVREGSSIHKALSRSGLFPPITLHLIASGETGGRLDEMLERAAFHQEREVETMIAALMGVFEPLLILTMGAIVLVIVLAIMLPIFDLNQLVGS